MTAPVVETTRDSPDATRARATQAAEPQALLGTVPRPADDQGLVALGDLVAGGLAARSAQWGIDGGQVLLVGDRPFLDLSGQAGFRSDGTLDGTVAMRAGVRLMGLEVAEARWTVAGWTADVPLAAPSVNLRGSTLAVDLAAVGPDVAVTGAAGMTLDRRGTGLTVRLPEGSLPPGIPLEPRVVELLRGLRGWDVSGLRAHPDSPVEGAPAFVSDTDLFFAPSRYGAHSPETAALLEGAVRAALAGVVGAVTPTPPAPPPRPAEQHPPPTGTTAVPAVVPPVPAVAPAAPEPQPAGSEAAPTAEAGGAPAQVDGAPRAAGAAGPASAPGEGAGGEGEAPVAVQVELLMPPAPTAPGPAARGRTAAVGRSAGGAARSARDLPSAEATVGGARAAVTEPVAETAARAREDLAAALGERPGPSPEIVALCERIRTAIREHRPVDEDELLSTDPTREANEAGATVTGSVEGQVQAVESGYDALDDPPAGTPVLTPTPVVPPPATSPAMGAAASGAAPDPIPAENLSLDADVAATDQRIADAGVDTRVTQAIPTAPFTTVREGRGELGEMAQQTPAELAAQQTQAIESAQADMATLQQQATQALLAARGGAVGQVITGQQGTVSGEQQTREAVGLRAQQVFTGARTAVDALLQPLSRTAIARWESGLTRLSQEFHDSLDAVQRWIDERHSGVDGFFVGLGDAVFGLPDWVIREYDRAESAFGDGVCQLLLDISTEVDGVVAAAQALITQARQDIDTLFTAMEAELPEWAAQERARFGGMLDGLSRQVTEARTSFVDDVSRRATTAVAEAQAAVEERREAARGVLGRIVAAIEAFIDDPVTAIINGLLTLVGIPPAAFWALVTRIQHVVADIAEDPESFINNLVAGLRQGFQQFFDNFGTHVLAGFWRWLFSGLQTPVPMPTELSARALFTFALQLMGVTWPRVREILVTHVGAQNVEIIEAAWELVSVLIERGPDGLVEMVKERLSPEVIVQTILEAAVEYLVETLIEQVVVRVIGMLNPAGAIAQAIDLIYQICAWVFRNAARIFRFVEAVVNGLADVVAGNITGMANAVERSLASLVPVAIDFLAGLLHMGDLPDQVAEVIVALQARVYEVMDAVIGAIAARGRALLAAMGIGGDDEPVENDDDELGTTVRFSAAGHAHRVFFQTAGEDTTLMVASVPQSIESKVAGWRDEVTAGKPADDALRAEASTTLGNLETVADEADEEGDRLAVLFLQADADENDEAEPPSDTMLENRERAIAGMLERLFVIMETKDPEEYVRDIADHLPRHGATYAGTVRDQWLGTIRRVRRAPAGGAGGSQLWPDTVLAGTATTGLDLLALDATHRQLLPWFLVGSTSNPRQASGGPFYSHAFQSDSPDPAHTVRRQFIEALGAAAAQALNASGLEVVTPQDNAELRDTVGQIAFSMTGGRWGSFDPWPRDEVNPLVKEAVRDAGGVLGFLRAMVSPGSSGGFTWAQFMAVWEASPATKNWVKAEFRGIAEGHHEWIPTGFIPQVIDTALAALTQGSLQDALRWLTAHTALRSPTNHVLHHLEITRVRAPRGVHGEQGMVTTVGASGHVGAFRDPADPTRTTGTVGTELFHDWLRAEFTAHSGAGAIAYVQHLQGELRTHVWDGSVADVPVDALSQPVGMLYRLDSGVDAALTVAQLGLRQRLSWQQIQRHFASALAETSR